MADKKKRGKVSKIDLLPEQIKNKLDELLRSGKQQQIEIVAEVNQMILDAGLPDSATLSASGVNRYSTQMHTAGQRIKEARQVSEQWIANLGDKPTGDVGKILIEMIRTIAFDNVLKASLDEEPMPPKLIKDLAISVERLEKASTESLKREKEIRQAFAEEAAELAENVAKKAGLTHEGASSIKKQILGIA